MKNVVGVLILFFALLVACTNEEDILIRIYEGSDFYELGNKCGYVNSNGDTIIPIGKYSYCYTDSLKNYAMVYHNGEAIAIDQNERKLYEVYWYDNGPDYVVDGLFRIIKNDKIGYANQQGKVIIKPQFECAFPFEEGKAKVTYNCELIPSGEHFLMESEHWFYIDVNGNKIK